ncbi:MAG: DUF4397 domain-containing protein [Chloroflexota bacterium]
MRSIIRFCLIALSLLLIVACGQNNPQVLPTLVASATPASPTEVATRVPTPPTSTPDPTLPRQGNIRIIHAAADAGVINVYAGFLSVATNLDFTQATETTPLDAGDYTIRVLPTGSGPNDKALFETPFTLKGGDSDIVVVTKKDGQFQLLTLPETVVPVNVGESVITLINAVSGTANISVQQNNANLTDPLPFGQGATSGILPVGSMALNIQTGTATPTPYNIELKTQQHYTLVITGQADKVSVASFSTNAPGRATIRAINASEALSSVDVYLDSTLLAGKVEFGRQAERQNWISGDYTVKVYAAGADRTTNEPLVSQMLSFEAESNITLLLTGVANNISVVPFNENLVPTAPGFARIAFFNTLESVPTLHVETTGGSIPGISDKGFGEAPDQTDLSANTYIFFLTRAGAPAATQSVETVQDVQLSQGKSYLYLVTGRDDNQPIILSEDIGVDENLAGVSPEDQVANASAEPIRLRFVNAIADQTTIDFNVNDKPMATAIAYGQGSDLIPVTQQSASISTVVSGSGDFLQSSENSLESGVRYTVIAYGPDKSGVKLMLLSDKDLIFDGRSPHLRLINLSINTDVNLGLGFAPQAPTPEGGATRVPFDDVRRSIPAGVQRLVENIAGGSVSSVILMPGGTYDIEILDSNTKQLANTISDNFLDSGAQYDVVVFEDPATTKVGGFVLEYPVRSAP